MVWRMKYFQIPLGQPFNFKCFYIFSHRKRAEQLKAFIYIIIDGKFDDFSIFYSTVP